MAADRFDAARRRGLHWLDLEGPCDHRFQVRLLRRRARRRAKADLAWFLGWGHR